MTSSLSLLDGTDFELSEQEVLGHGTLGPLHRGRQRSTGREAAIRFLAPSAPSTPATLEARLRRYAEQLAPLEASGLVPVIGTGVAGDKVYYAMELVAGESLSECIAQAHRFTTDEIIHVAEGAVGALRSAWKSGLVPVGIKPSNVFLTVGGAVRLAEAGLAAAVSEGTGIPIVRAQGRYVAPELVFGDAPDVRSDLYSLGVMLYELATRTLPFEGYDSTTSFHYQLMHVEPAAPREQGSLIPRELERVVLRCLAKSPSDRYQSPDELLEDLQAVRRRQGSSPNLPGLPPDEPGDFDIYEDQVIGEGGMGILYRARQHSLGRPVAVKVIRDVFTASPEFVQRFRQEAELLAQVNHTNVVQVFGTGTWHGRLFYAMELVEGKDVSTRLRDCHRFTPREVLHVAEGVARALAAAWKFRIVHRDIKPSNILLTADGSVKVADFGLAKSLRIRKSESRLIAGTAEYISPEQGMGLPVDIRSDIYSLGVVLYELLMGKPPFKSDGSFTFVVYQHVHSSPPALGPMQGAAAIPGPVKEIIQKCLEKKPERRFQKPEELLAAILKARESLEPQNPAGESAAPARPRTTGSGRGWRSIGRNAVLIGVLLAGITGVLLALRHYGSPSESPAPAVAADIELLLGLGDYDTALDVARKRWGELSSEYRAIMSRREESRRAEAEHKGLAAVARRDWAAAESALLRAVVGSEPVRKQELMSVLQFSRELLQAKHFEEAGRIDEAIQLYQVAAERAPTVDGYCRDSISRLKAIRASSPHSK